MTGLTGRDQIITGIRMGRLAQARIQLATGLTEAVVPGDDWYGEMVRSGLECLADRIGDARGVALEAA